MSGAKGPLLLVAGGCAAMVGAAALTVSLGSFFADIPTTRANAAAASVVPDLPVKKVKTVVLTPKAEAAPVEQASADPAPAAAAQNQELTVADVTPAADELHKTDPRWARTNPVPANAPAAASDGEQPLEQAFATPDDERASQANPFAALEPGTIELEQTVDELPSPAPRRQTRRDDDDADKGAVQGGRTVTVSAGVNMRSAARSGSRVIGTIPAGAKVNISPDCKSWCRVTWKGSTGYVWRSFVGGGGKASAAKPRTRRVAAAAQPDADQPQAASAGLFGNAGNLNNTGTPKIRTRSATPPPAVAADPTENKIFEPENR